MLKDWKFIFRPNIFFFFTFLEGFLLICQFCVVKMTIIVGTSFCLEIFYCCHWCLGLYCCCCCLSFMLMLMLINVFNCVSMIWWSSFFFFFSICQFYFLCLFIVWLFRIASHLYSYIFLEQKSIANRKSLILVTSLLLIWQKLLRIKEAFEINLFKDKKLLNPHKIFNSNRFF